MINLNTIQQQELLQKQQQTQVTQQVAQEENIFNKVGQEFKSWINDEDKVCEDGKDDGKLSFKENLEYFGKGLLGIVKGAAKHPIITGLTVAAGAALALNPITGPALLAAAPAIAGAGAIFSAGTIAYGGYKASQANNDAEAKQAWETIGNGTFGLALAGASAGKALNAASKAGVAACDGLATGNPVTNTINCIKTTPQALAQSAANLKADYLTAATGAIQANSNALRAGTKGNEIVSKANDAQAYRFNPNGTPDEIVANNPGVFVGDDGNYYVNNKWDANNPFRVDTSSEQMIMMYGPDDMAVCDGKVFNSSYVDSAAFKANGAQNYQNPADLNYGQVIDVTKQAKGSFMIAPEGTKVQTLEGPAVVGKNQVIAVDGLGNPYVQPAATTIKKNILTDSQSAKLLEVATGIKTESTIGYQIAPPYDFDKTATISYEGKRSNLTIMGSLGDDIEYGKEVLASKDQVIDAITTGKKYIDLATGGKFIRAN